MSTRSIDVKEDKDPYWFLRTVFTLKHRIGATNERKRLAKEAIQYLAYFRIWSFPACHLLEQMSGVSFATESMRLRDETDPNPSNDLLENLVKGKYDEALLLLETQNIDISHFCRQTEDIAKVLIVKKEFDGLHKLQIRLDGFYQTNKDLIYSNVFELEAFKRSKVIILCTWFLKGNFFDACDNFLQLKCNDEELFNEIYQSSNLTFFFVRDELRAIIIVSILIAIPLNNLEEFSKLSDLRVIFGELKLLKKLVELLVNASFQQFLSIWDSQIKPLFTNSFILYSLWVRVNFLMSSKIYFFYLQVSKNIRISYLSKVLDIDKILLRQQIVQLIEVGNLNYKFDEVDSDIINHFEKSSTFEVFKEFEVNETRLLNRFQDRNELFENIVAQSTNDIQEVSDGDISIE